ncbi:hypothetical protein D3C86_2157300 [compost metagenome]
MTKVQKESEHQMNGYALYNVQRRLELHYKNEASLTVESKLGTFTRVIITIPLFGKEIF